MKHKFCALCLTLVMAMSAATLFSACGEEKTPSGDVNVTDPSGSGQNPDEGNKNPDGGGQNPGEGGQNPDGGEQNPGEGGEGGQPAPEEEQATEGLHYTAIYGEDNTTAIGYIVGAGEAAEEENIVIPAKHDGLPVLRIGLPEEYFGPDSAHEGAYNYTDKFFESYNAYVAGLGYNFEELEYQEVLAVRNSFIQQYSFAYSKAKTIKIPNSVTQLGILAFSESSIESLYIPESVTEIETLNPQNPVYHSEGNCLIETATKTVIAGCKTSVIPEGVLAIGAGAFACMEELEEINIPKSVTVIRNYAFLQCTKLKRIVYGGTEEEWKNIDKRENNYSAQGWRTGASIEEVVCTNGTLTGSDIG